MSQLLRRRIPVGAEVQPDGSTHFRVWAPAPARVALVLEGRTDRQDVTLTKEADDFYGAYVSDVGAGARYWFRVDDDLLPDPASRSQPDGPFGASEVVDPGQFRWTDAAWRGRRLDGRQVITEIHVGTFTPEGTWRAAAGKLPLLRDTGIDVIEVMPVAEFPGRFGWGYDGVFPYAPSRLYGRPDDFRAFVNEAHRLDLAVILDVVYNHLGPDGCVFRRYAPPYFTDRYENEWGESLNFDGPDAAPAREYWSSNAGYWIDEFHLDGLRLDATQSIHDLSEEHILREIGRRAREAAAGRDIMLIAENEPQDTRLVRPLSEGGYGLDGLWNDDLHHSALVALTGRNEAYYSDHHGTPQEFVSAAKYGYLFQGQRYHWQKHARGTSGRGVSPVAFVNFIENHDQIANFGDGSRLRVRTTGGRLRAMTALILLMPGTPMLFQGQEFGATAPFLYFADHKPELAEAVRKGRAEFVRQFPSMATAEVQASLPAPHDVETFTRCVLDWSERDRHTSTLHLHRDLIALRRRQVGFQPGAGRTVDGAVLAPEAFVLRFMTEHADDERLLVVNFGPDLARGSFAEPLVAPPGQAGWELEWSSESLAYGGSGAFEIVTVDGWLIPGHSATVLRPRAEGSVERGSGSEQRTMNV